jgi:hypothetical protein
LRCEVLSRPGPDKTAALFPMTVDLLFANQSVDQGEGVGGVG